MKEIPIMKPHFDENEVIEIKKVLKSGWVAQGPKVAEFEDMVARSENVNYAIATTSCTTALHLLMVAMGLNENHEIIVPSYTFVATANAVVYTGATPILADVETDTYNISPPWVTDYIKSNYQLKNGKQINKKTGKELFGIVAVNLFGLSADIPKINKIAEEFSIKVIEDSACALGAAINGKKAASFGNPSCLSFHPRKSITTGEGGMILTDDSEIADKTRKLRSHGASISEVDRHKAKGYLLPDFDDLGYNYRMNDIQAAVGVGQMLKFDKVLKEKLKRTKDYDRLLKSLEEIKAPFVPKGYLHTYQSYVCMLDIKKLGLDIPSGKKFRDEIMDRLENIGIATRQGTHAVHTLGYYKNNYGYKEEDLTGAYQCDSLSIALPLYYGITSEEQKFVINSLKKAIKEIKNEKY